ncbi:MAG: UDP-2,4-diacetamido-2,4,6-trideoxy-beta-L-altropyranose hydrolase [Halothiobacillaceae bacterium]|nr:UDP-2,4-diacetamido-2,4,6-trideoxy-beta-L-altropyranose hydrolase [Halothiobacillaceae bacterium]
MAFRVDASSRIGTGHFMRCLTLADMLQEQGAQIRFVSRGLPEYLRDMLVARGMGFACLKDAVTAEAPGDLGYSIWPGTGQTLDAADSTKALADLKWDWLVVDHYALDARWESAMRDVAERIMVIDDLANRNHDCDVLLDQNYYRDMGARYGGKVPEQCRLLLGPRYALLREEFRILREQVEPRTGEVGRILVFFGGVDAGNYTSLAIRTLAGLDIKGAAVDVVIGAQHPRRSEIEKTCAKLGYVCHVQTSRMAELMAAADLAICAGGSATWERCCLGLPALTFCAAENQRVQIADAAEAGLLYAPSVEGNLVDILRRHARCLMENSSLLRSISRASMECVDGRGAMRVSSLFGIGNIEIRRATENDSIKLFEWRNHPAIRSVSRNYGLIDRDAHCSWFSAVLADEDCELLIGCIGDEPIGVVRFEKAKEVAEISIYLVPGAGFTGQGRNLLLSAERWLVVNRPDIKQILAEVLGANPVSQKLFLGADYRIEKIQYLKELKV